MKTNNKSPKPFTNIVNTTPKSINERANISSIDSNTYSNPVRSKKLDLTKSLTTEMMKKTQPEYMQSFMKIDDDKDDSKHPLFESVGTSIPWMQSLYTDVILNNSSVNISDFQRVSYTNPVVARSLTSIKDLVLNNIDKYTNKIKEHEDFINQMFDNMSKPFNEVLSEMMTALAQGFYIGEKIYSSDGRYLYIDRIDSRPASSILFRVGPDGNLLEDGVMQYYFNNMWQSYSNLLSYPGMGGEPNPYSSLGDFSYPIRSIYFNMIGLTVIPRSKCVHFTYQGTDGLDYPYGRSILRPIWDTVIAQSEMLKNSLIAANFKSSNLPVIVVDPSQYESDQFGPMEDIANALQNASGGNSFLLLKGVLDKSISIKEIQSVASISDLESFNRYLDQIIALGLLLPMEGSGLSSSTGGYSRSKSQIDLLSIHIESIADRLTNTIIRDIVKPIIQYNFGEQDNYGSFSSRNKILTDIESVEKVVGILEANSLKMTTEYLANFLDINPEQLEEINRNETVEVEERI